MKDYLYSAFVIAIILFLVPLATACLQYTDSSYIGKTRDDIIADSLKWNNQLVPKKITIGTPVSYYHLDTPKDIYKEEYLMHANVWRINYYIKKGFFNKLCSYEIRFKNNIVISQKVICSSDAI